VVPQSAHEDADRGVTVPNAVSTVGTDHFGWDFLDSLATASAPAASVQASETAGILALQPAVMGRQVPEIHALDDVVSTVVLDRAGPPVDVGLVLLMILTLLIVGLVLVGVAERCCIPSRQDWLVILALPESLLRVCDGRRLLLTVVVVGSLHVSTRTGFCCFLGLLVVLLLGRRVGSHG
jgi:hypothetical protein